MNLSSTLGPVLVPGGGLQKAIEYFDDFVTAGFLTNTAGRAGKFDETANSGEWLVTVTDGGGDNAETILVDDAWPGGILTMTPNNAAADGMTAQLNGEAFKLTRGKTTVIRFKLAPGDIDKVRWFCGLANTVAAGVCASSASWVDYIGFGCYTTDGLDGTPDGSIAVIIGRDATEADAIGHKATTTEIYVDTGVNFSADTSSASADYQREFCIIVQGDQSAEFYIDGTLVYTYVEPNPGHTTLAILSWDGNLTPTLGFACTDTSQGKLFCDYVQFLRDR